MSALIDLRHFSFAREYAKHHNGTKAYRAVYPKIKTDAAAAVQASKLLRNPKVMAIVAELERDAAQMAEIDTAKLLRESARLAFVDPRKCFHADGRTKQPHELDDDTAAAIAGIERHVEYKTAKKNGKKTRRQVVTYRYKVLDKNPSHERLFKHRGLFRPVPHTPFDDDLPIDLDESVDEDVVDVARRIVFTLELASRRRPKKKAAGK